MEEEREDSMDESAEDDGSRSSSEGGVGDLDSSVRGEMGEDKAGDSIGSRRLTGVVSMAERLAVEGARSRAGVWVDEGKRVREGTKEARETLEMYDMADWMWAMGDEKIERALEGVGSGDDGGCLDWERVRLSEPRRWEEEEDEESQVVNFDHPCPLSCCWPARLFTAIVFPCRRPAMCNSAYCLCLQ
jgi:hypothetical protein